MQVSILASGNRHVIVSTYLYAVLSLTLLRGTYASEVVNDNNNNNNNNNNDNNNNNNDNRSDAVTLKVETGNQELADVEGSATGELTTKSAPTTPPALFTTDDEVKVTKVKTHRTLKVYIIGDGIVTYASPFIVISGLSSINHHSWVFIVLLLLI